MLHQQRILKKGQFCLYITGNFILDKGALSRVKKIIERVVLRLGIFTIIAQVLYFQWNIRMWNIICISHRGCGGGGMVIYAI